MSEEMKNPVGQDEENTIFLKNIEYSDQNENTIVVKNTKKTELQKKGEPTMTIPADDFIATLDKEGNIHYKYKSKEEREIK